MRSSGAVVLWLALVILTTLPTTVFGGGDHLAVFIPSGSEEASTHPVLAEIDGVPNELHGTYSYMPYYAISRLEKGSTPVCPPPADGDKDRKLTEDEIFLVSDYGLMVKLKPRGDDSPIHDATFCQFPADSYDNVTITVKGGREDCGGQRDDRYCFTVAGTPPTELEGKLDGTYNHLEGMAGHPTGSPFRQVFGKTPQTWTMILSCFDVRKMDGLNFQNNRCTEDLFAYPDDTSTRWESVGADQTLPFGWRYVPSVIQTGRSHSQFVASEKELRKSQEQSLGFNIEGGVGVEGAGSANLGYSKTTATKQVADDINKNQVFYSYHDYLSTHHVLVVIKGELDLSDTFAEYIEGLQDGRYTFDAVIRKFGTHYAFATTYGARGRATNRYNADTIAHLVENNVSVSQSMDAGVKAEAEGVDGSLKGGVQWSTVNDTLNKLENEYKVTDEDYKCFGGSSCDAGHPSGEAHVPVLLDLRPISELLGPPFFTDGKTVIELRLGLRAKIQEYAFSGELSDSPVKFIAVTSEVTYDDLDQLSDDGFLCIEDDLVLNVVTNGKRKPVFSTGRCSGSECAAAFKTTRKDRTSVSAVIPIKVTSGDVAVYLDAVDPDSSNRSLAGFAKPIAWLVGDGSPKLDLGQTVPFEFSTSVKDGCQVHINGGVSLIDVANVLFSTP